MDLEEIKAAIDALSDEDFFELEEWIASQTEDEDAEEGEDEEE